MRDSGDWNMKLTGPVGKKAKKKVTFANPETAKVVADGSSGYVGLAPRPKNDKAGFIQNPVIVPTLKLNQSTVGPVTQSQIYPERTSVDGPIISIPKPDLGQQRDTTRGFSEVRKNQLIYFLF